MAQWGGRDRGEGREGKAEEEKEERRKEGWSWCE